MRKVHSLTLTRCSPAMKKIQCMIRIITLRLSPTQQILVSLCLRVFCCYLSFFAMIYNQANPINLLLIIIME